MRKILYIANVNSPHIKEWLKLLDASDAVVLASIEKPSCENTLTEFSNFKILQFPSIFYKIPKIARYAILGFALRAGNYKDYIFHAHNVSGYGLSALISGKQFIATTYGSEIYSAPKKSILYRYLLRKALEKASSITASAESMRKHFAAHYPKEITKLETFSLGVKTEFLSTEQSNRNPETETVWISNRRIHPLYHIDMIVREFISFRKVKGSGRLILLSGDADKLYLKNIMELSRGHSAITVVERLMSARELSELIKTCDFSISIPDSDQLSSSILESMCLNCIPIIRPLPAYNSISSACISLDATKPLTDSIKEAFFKTSELDESEILRLSSIGRNFVLKTHSNESAKLAYEAILRQAT